MDTSQFRAEIAFLVSLLAVAPAALGDAACNAGLRDVTPAERTRITTALQSAESALPPAPEGWRQVNADGQFSIPSSICRDGENKPWLYGTGRSYTNVTDPEKRQKVMADAAAAAAADRAKNQSRMDALQKQMTSIMQQQMALNQNKDYAGAERLQPQLEKVQAEYERLATASTANIEAAGREFERDLEMSVSVGVNSTPQRPARNVTNLPKPASAVAAVRWQDEDPAATNEYALVLFGPWKPDPNGGWRPGLRAGVPPSGAHAVSVYVIADRDRLANVVQQIDFAKISPIVR
jgi:hypothetical protein